MIITTPSREAALEKLYHLVEKLQKDIDIDLFITRVITHFELVFLETEKNTDTAINSIMWGFIEKVRQLATKKSDTINFRNRNAFLGTSPA